MGKILSIVTTTLNSENYLENVIKSVANLKSEFEEKIEYIIVDGSSKDKTVDIIKKYHYKGIVDKYISENDFGIFNAMNKGINLSAGDYVLFIGSDDYLISENFKEVIFCLEKEKPDICYGNTIIIDKKGKVVRRHVSGKYNPLKLEFGWHSSHPSTIIKRNLLLKIGGFNENYKIAADVDLEIKAFKLSKNIKYIDKYLAVYRQGGTSTKNLKNIFKANLEVYKSAKYNGIKFPAIFVFNKISWKIFQILLELFRFKKFTPN